MKDIIALFLFEISIITALLILTYITRNKYLLGITLTFTAFLLYFNRNFKGHINKSEDIVIVPAEGRVTQIIKGKDYNTVHIFLNVHNIHKQYVPYSGKIVHIEEKKGFYKKAYNPNAHRMNTKIITIFDTDIGKILLEQISGFLVRKVITYKKVGDKVNKGDKLGFIKFGSLVTITLPKSVKIVRHIGEKVKIGSVLGVINNG